MVPPLENNYFLAFSDTQLQHFRCTISNSVKGVLFIWAVREAALLYLERVPFPSKPGQSGKLPQIPI